LAGGVVRGRGGPRNRARKEQERRDSATASVEKVAGADQLLVHFPHIGGPTPLVLLERAADGEVIAVVESQVTPGGGAAVATFSPLEPGEYLAFVEPMQQ